MVDFYTLIYLMSPAILAGLFHMFLVKANLATQLTIPINEKYFGKNKTWRGVIAMILFGVLSCQIIIWIDRLLPLAPQVSFEPLGPWLSGALLGLAFALAELPNSFIKRRLGVPEGKRPKKHFITFSLIDQADSAIGCAIVYGFLFEISWQSLFAIVVLGTLIHFILNFLLYLIGVRKEPI